ncbi:MAG: SDR family oxidoreductase [Burkholderiales bacterium]
MNDSPPRLASKAQGQDPTASAPRVAVISGAANGIGWATAKLMAGNSWRVALLDMDDSALRDRAAQLGPQHIGLVCDVTDAAEVNAAFGVARSTLGRVDALINCAGISDQTGPTLEQSIEAFDRVLAVHLRGSFLMMQAALRAMLTQSRDEYGNRGSIVNLGSIASLGGIPGRNAYSAAKAGIVGMTRTLASEWAREGVRVNTVAPGYVRTQMVDHLERQGAINGGFIAHRTPMGRIADPDEIAQVIAFLASPVSSYVTGAVLPVDGGWSAFGASESTLPAL